MKKIRHRKTIKSAWRQFWQVLFYFTLKPFFALYFFIFHNLHFQRNHFKIPKGPVLFISNHHSNFDGFYLNIMFYWRIIHFVVNEELFITRLTSFVSRFLLGEVKRGVTDADVGFIFDLKRYVLEGRSVGLFPEGDIHFFGETLPIEKSLAKLAKMLGIPIVCLQVHGAHLRAPRCGNKAHRGKIVYEITDVIPQEMVKTSGMDALLNRMVTGIKVHENNYQRKVMTKMIGNRRAEWLELGLFLCPQCHDYETLKSEGNQLHCTHCNLEIHVNSYGFLEQKKGDLSATDFKNYDDCSKWNAWQLGELHRNVSMMNDNQTVFFAKDMHLQQTKVGRYFSLKSTPISCELTRNTLQIFASQHQKILTISLVDLQDCLVQYKDVLELIYAGNRYRISTKKRKWSAYLWAQTIQYLTTMNSPTKKI